MPMTALKFLMIVALLTVFIKSGLSFGSIVNSSTQSPQFLTDSVLVNNLTYQQGQEQQEPWEAPSTLHQRNQKNSSHENQEEGRVSLQQHQRKEEQYQKRLLQQKLLQIDRLEEQHRQQHQYQLRSPRKSPRILQHPLHASTLLTDQSSYVRLGDNAGSVIAIGDFTADRYPDLLVVLDTNRPRCMTVLCWSHQSFSFQPSVEVSPNVSAPIFCIDSIPHVASHALIASAHVLDANVDGLLDVMLILRKSSNKHFAALLLGNGDGSFNFDQILSDVTPFALIMDANDDMRSDIFFITPNHQRIFYINNSSGIFERHVWDPFPSSNLSFSSNFSCLPTYPFNSNAFIDIDGDCVPDLVITTTCGIEVWLNEPPNSSGSNTWRSGHYYPKPTFNIHQARLPDHHNSYVLLNRTIWDPESGDSTAVFADFNADGATDIAVLNPERRSLRISYGVRRSHVSRRLCARDGPLRFLTRSALKDIESSAVNLGLTTVPAMVRTGDFNFDGLLDLLFVDADSGTVSLFKATIAHGGKKGWLDRASWPRTLSLLDRILFPIIGGDPEAAPRETEIVTFLRYVESPILHHVEDPLAAAFFDTDERGRQDIIISQRHGTRLIWNNFENMDDIVYFKATAVNSISLSSSKGRFWPGTKINPDPSVSNVQPFSPLPGNTFKITYGGRYRRETHICSQCPQSSVLTLQSCSCLFGITQIANYIEEMAMGGAGGVQSWMALMPNALAMVWPQPQTLPGGFVKWRVSYLSKGRDGQMKRIVVVLCVTLAVLLVAIIYMHNVEQNENSDGQKFEFGQA